MRNIPVSLTRLLEAIIKYCLTQPESTYNDTMKPIERVGSTGWFSLLSPYWRTLQNAYLSKSNQKKSCGKRESGGFRYLSS